MSTNSVPPEYFSRVAGSVNFPLLQSKHVVVVGIGQVGSQLAEELAKCGLGHLLLIDHDRLERSNLFRHALTDDYLGRNKAEAMTVFLGDEVEDLDVKALPCRVDDAVSDDLLDEWLTDADLIIAATDDHEAQRRIGEHALQLDITVVFPALHAEGGGEVILQLDRNYACFGCWGAFRDGIEQLQGMTATNFSAHPVIFTSLAVCLGILDPHSEWAEFITQGPGNPPTQVFILNRFGALERRPFRRSAQCPVCANRPVPPSLRHETPRAIARTRTLPDRPSGVPRKTNPVLSASGKIASAIGVALLAIVAVIGGSVAACAACFVVGGGIVFVIFEALLLFLKAIS